MISTSLWNYSCRMWWPISLSVFFLKLVIWSEASRHQSATDPFDRILVSQSSPKSTQINTIQFNLQQ